MVGKSSLVYMVTLFKINKKKSSTVRMFNTEIVFHRKMRLDRRKLDVPFIDQIYFMF